MLLQKRKFDTQDIFNTSNDGANVATFNWCFLDFNPLCIQHNRGQIGTEDIIQVQHQLNVATFAPSSEVLKMS